MQIIDRLKGDYASMCYNRADLLEEELARGLAAYGPEGGWTDAASGHQRRVTVEDVRDRQATWRLRARVAERGRFLVREEDARDAHFMLDPEISGLRHEAAKAGLLTDRVVT